MRTTFPSLNAEKQTSEFRFSNKIELTFFSKVVERNVLIVFDFIG